MGIEASFKNKILTIRKTAQDDASDQCASAILLLPSLTIGEGFIVSYDVRWIDIANTEEAKMHSPFDLAGGSSLFLRYHNSSMSWVTWQDGLLTQSVTSRIKVDSVWHTVLFYYTNDSVTVFENGNVVLTKDVELKNFQLFFAMQSSGHRSTFHAQIRNIVTIPTAFHTDLPSLPTRERSMEIVFSAPAQSKSQHMWSTTGRNGLAVKYTSGSLQFYARDPKNT